MYGVVWQALSEIVTDDDLEKGSLYPPLQNIKDCSVKIAKRVADRAFETGKKLIVWP